MCAEPSGARVGSDREQAKFDRFARGYDAGMDAPLKRLVGGNAESFITIKAEWFLRFVRHHPAARPGDCQLLDFGCGTATLLRVLRRLGYQGALAGCDVSPAMLEEGRRVWDVGAVPELALQSDGVLPYADCRFDFVLASAVFHHIPCDERAHWLREVFRVVKPGGHVIVFEHNPWNPITRFVVSRTPIDADAVLQSPSDAADGLRRAGFEDISSSALMFFPPRLQFLRPLERALSWLPLGGQYAAVGRRRV